MKIVFIKQAGGITGGRNQENILRNIRLCEEVKVNCSNKQNIFVSRRPDEGCVCQAGWWHFWWRRPRDSMPSTVNSHRSDGMKTSVLKTITCGR